MHKIELKDISKSYSALTVLKGISLQIKPGSFVALVGPSGCGKSTLLRAIAGLEDIDSGSILINGEDITDRPASERGVAMVFQSYALYPHMTVYDNISYNLKIAKCSKEEIAKRVNFAEGVLRLQGLMDRLPSELSGGQKQRVAIGRAIVRNPEVFLFDEPLSNLDADLRVHTRVELAKLHRQLQATTIYVTHDQVEAMTLADTIVVLSKGEIMQIGSPLQLYRDPDNLFVAGFIGSPKMNILKAAIVTNKAKTLDIQIPGLDTKFTKKLVQSFNSPEGQVNVGVRPEDLKLVFNSRKANARIITVENLGNVSYLYLTNTAGESLIAEYRGAMPELENSSVRIEIDNQKLFLFDESGNRMR